MTVILEEKVTTKTKLQPPKKYNLWILDNEITSFEEVIVILTEGANLSVDEAKSITLKVHHEGKAKLNKKPMPKQIAEALKDNLNNVKRAIAMSPISKLNQRERAIMELKFIVKED